MAGLPKAVLVLLSVVGIVVALALTGVGQVGFDVLQPVFDLIDSNVNVDSTDQANLKADFENAAALRVGINE